MNEASDLDVSLSDVGHGTIGPSLSQSDASEGLSTVLSRRSQRVLFASAKECPFVKVGGLADVSSGLPKRLAELGYDVGLVIPAYRGLGGGHVLTFDVVVDRQPSASLLEFRSLRFQQHAKGRYGIPRPLGNACRRLRAVCAGGFAK